MRQSRFAVIVALSFDLSSVVLQQKSAKAEIIYGITEQAGGEFIFSFDSGTPGTLLSYQRLTGLLSGSGPGGVGVIEGGIDFRPANGELYGLGENRRIYSIDARTGMATLVSTLHSAQP